MRLAWIGVLAASVALAQEKGGQSVPAALNFTMKTLDGKDVELSKYRGKVVLLVNVASDSRSIWSSTALRIMASYASSKGFFSAAAAARRTIDSTPASCCGPMTAVLLLGQMNRNRGRYAYPHMP